MSPGIDECLARNDVRPLAAAVRVVRIRLADADREAALDLEMTDADQPPRSSVAQSALVQVRAPDAERQLEVRRDRPPCAADRAG